MDKFNLPPFHSAKRFGTHCFLAATSFLLFLGSGTICHAQMRQAWIAKYNNGILNGSHQAVKIALDGAGNVYVTGFSQNATGNLDYATIKYATNGSQLWATRYVATNTTFAQPTSLVLDTNTNVVITGSAGTVKYDNNGNQLWIAPYLGNTVAVDVSNNVFVSGFATNLGVVKLNSAGSSLWQVSQSVAYVATNIGQSISLDTNGNCYVASYTTFFNNSVGPYFYGSAIKYNANGLQLWTNQFEYGDYAEPLIQSTALDASNNFYVLLNNVSGPYATPYSSFKFAGSTGALLWQASDPARNFASFGEGLALDGTGNVWVTGSEVFSYPNSQYGTYRLNQTNGSYNVTNLYPATANAISAGNAIVTDRGNNAYVTGYSPGTNTGNDMVTIKYGSNGNQVWLQRYNGPGNSNDAGNAIAVDALGNVYVTGYDTTSAGGTEMVTIKYAPTLTIQKESNGFILLQSQGEPGETLDFQASTNFQTWLDLGRTNADTNGLIQFLDTNASKFSYRFYITLP
jgi:Beta-propeller repeat